MFPRPTSQARLQCFQNDPMNQEMPPTPGLQQKSLGLPVISPVDQLQPLRQPNIITSVQLQTLRQPNIIPPLQQQTLRQLNLILPVQQQQTLRQPNIISPVQQPLKLPNTRSPVQQKQPLRQLNIISPGQQKQPLAQSVQNKQVLQNRIQQEQIPLEVTPISGQPQKKPVLLPKTLWQRLHPEEDELSLLVKSHYVEKQQRSVTKKKKLSIPRQLKQGTLLHSMNPLQEIPILKEQAPTLVLKEQSPQLIPITKGQTPSLILKQQSPPQPIPALRQEQIDLQQNHISEDPQPSSGTLKTWQDQLNLLQETPITKPRRHSGLPQHQRPIPRQQLQQTKQARQEPEESLLQIYSQFRGTEDVQQKYISKTRLSTKMKRGLTKMEAKSDAAEEALRLLMNKQMKINDVADHNLQEDFIIISDSEEDVDSPISMKQLTSLALCKLFEDWKKMETEQSVNPPSASAKAEVDPLATLHPCDLLSRMRGSLPYSLILQESTPQGAVFFVGVTVDGSTYVGKGTTKKDARFRAAKVACEAIFKVVYP